MAPAGKKGGKRRAPPVPEIHPEIGIEPIYNNISKGKPRTAFDRYHMDFARFVLGKMGKHINVRRYYHTLEPIKTYGGVVGADTLFSAVASEIVRRAMREEFPLMLDSVGKNKEEIKELAALHGITGHHVEKHTPAILRGMGVDVKALFRDFDTVRRDITFLGLDFDTVFKHIDMGEMHALRRLKKKNKYMDAIMALPGAKQLVAESLMGRYAGVQDKDFLRQCVRTSLDKIRPGLVKNPGELLDKYANDALDRYLKTYGKDFKAKSYLEGESHQVLWARDVTSNYPADIVHDLVELMDKKPKADQSKYITLAFDRYKDLKPYGGELDDFMRGINILVGEMRGKRDQDTKDQRKKELQKTQAQRLTMTAAVPKAAVILAGEAPILYDTRKQQIEMECPLKSGTQADLLKKAARTAVLDMLEGGEAVPRHVFSILDHGDIQKTIGEHVWRAKRVTDTTYIDTLAPLLKSMGDPMLSMRLRKIINNPSRLKKKDL